MSEELEAQLNQLQAAVDRNTSFVQSVAAHVAALQEAVFSSDANPDVLAKLHALTAVLESNNAGLDAVDGVDGTGEEGSGTTGETDEQG